jgi:ABC-type nitrate/sulfonate/bicarbonate transport system permease component
MPWAAMIIIEIAGFAFDRIMALLELRLQRWRSHESVFRRALLPAVCW